MRGVGDSGGEWPPCGGAETGSAPEAGTREGGSRRESRDPGQAAWKETETCCRAAALQQRLCRGRGAGLSPYHPGDFGAGPRGGRIVVWEGVPWQGCGARGSETAAASAPPAVVRRLGTLPKPARGKEARGVSLETRVRSSGSEAVMVNTLDTLYGEYPLR